MKYKAKKLQNRPSWAVFTGKTYFTSTVVGTQREAEIIALHYSAHWHQEQMDKIHRELTKMDAITQGDEYGYLA